MKHYADSYKNLPTDDKAMVLVSTLQHCEALHDWGWLTPSESYDNYAAEALLDLGKDAIKYLIPVLDDKNHAGLFKSAATMSSYYGYRRCDFAYRYVCLILNRPAEFRDTPEIRDQNIEALKRELKN